MGLQQKSTSFSTKLKKAVCHLINAETCEEQDETLYDECKLSYGPFCVWV